MDENILVKRLISLGENGDLDASLDAFEIIKNYRAKNTQEVLDGNFNTVSEKVDEQVLNSTIQLNKELRNVLAKFMAQGEEQAIYTYKQSLLLDAPYSMDCAWRYAEWERPPEKRFYEPRRKQLLPVMQAFDRLDSGKINRLLIEMIPGAGKTTAAEGFLIRQAFKYPELANLIGSHSNSFLRGLYDELIRMADPEGEYLWHEIFPGVKMTNTNAKDMRIDFGARKRFETFQLSSVGSGNAGKVRASGLLYLDDLVDGLESAMSKERMDKLWSLYNTDYRQRMIGDCAELIIATPWSLHDPIDKLELMYADDPMTEVIKLPALDENDESNFDYPYGLGFTTEFLHEQRELMDDASWQALYMMKPIEREGQLYAPEELSYFDMETIKGLKEPDAVIAVCDTKEQGNDYLAMPIAHKHGDMYYITGWVCDNGKPEILEEKVARTIVDRNVEMARFESNRGGTLFAENVRKKVRERQLIKKSNGESYKNCAITTKWNQTNKETRIVVASSWVKQHCVFLVKDEWDKEYRTAMEMMFGYTMAGKNKHDDVVDVLADLEDLVESTGISEVKVFRRIF